MEIRSLFLACFSLILCTQAKAEGTKKNHVSTPLRVEKSEKTLGEQATELMANRMSPATIKSDELAVAKLEEYNKLLDHESLMFPADELYNSNWDTESVNPFRKNEIEFPNYYKIDCSSFVMPLDHEKVRVTSKYGPRRRRMHRGIDLALSTGDTVRAAFDGKVRIKSYERRGYGYYVVLRHPNGFETVYGHLSKISVKANQIVRAGDCIGLGGNTGRSTGPHLHFEVRFLGRDIDPAEIINFSNREPYKDEYVFNNIKSRRKSKTYTSSKKIIARHRVKRGETLSRIAKKYGTTVSALCRLNKISRRSKIRIGQSLKVTKTVRQTTTAKTKKTTLSQPHQNKDKNVAAKKIEVPIKESAEKGPVYHKIRSGETLYSLAKKYGLTLQQLCEINNIKKNTIIKVGQRIRCS